MLVVCGQGSPLAWGSGVLVSGPAVSIVSMGELLLLCVIVCFSGIFLVCLEGVLVPEQDDCPVYPGGSATW